MAYLLERGADPNATEPINKSTILHSACEIGSTDIVELLLRYDANVHIRDIRDRTPLMEACRSGCSEIVKMLLERLASDIDPWCQVDLILM